MTRLLPSGAGSLLTGAALACAALAGTAQAAHAASAAPRVAGAAAQVTGAVPAGAAAAPVDLRTVRLPWFWPNNYLYDISAAAPDSVWIAGVQGELIIPGPIPGTGTSLPGNPVVRRWNGTGWQEYPLRGYSGNGSMTNVTAVSPNDVWVSGTRYVNGTAASPYLARHTGSGFDPVAPPEGVRGAGVRALPGGLFFTGEVGGEARIFRRSGDAWTPYPPTGLRSHALHARTPDDVWIFGEVGASTGTVGTPTARHWNGTAWQTTPLPAFQSRYVTFTGAYALGPDDVWTVGIDRVSGDPEGSVFLLHWDGATWSRVAAPAGINEAGDMARDGTGALWVATHLIGTPNRPGLMRNAGQGWELVPTPAVSGQQNVLMRDLAAVPTSGKVWLMGSGSIGGPIVMTDG
ncbi:hypothetical protein [Spirillospora sp. NPDC047279]|uniref:hypothetical protein n=1 Tax=Spirillospora sp. NPDC047279 TaxID=3155478 RepID=UPI0033D2DCB4